MKYQIESVTSGRKRHYILFTHGMFHQPTAILDADDMRMIADYANHPNHPMSNEQIASSVKAMRKFHRMAQDEAANLLGISRTYLSMIERGEADNLSLNIYRKIIAWIEEATM